MGVGVGVGGGQISRQEEQLSAFADSNYSQAGDQKRERDHWNSITQQGSPAAR